MPETKIWDHFSIQIYPLLVGNMASETTFGHWKVVFSWGKGRKMTFSQNLLIARFWASGFWMSILSSANFKKDPPWKIFFLSVHAPATSDWAHPGSAQPPTDGLLGWNACVLERRPKQLCPGSADYEERGALAGRDFASKSQELWNRSFISKEKNLEFVYGKYIVSKRLKPMFLCLLSLHFHPIKIVPKPPQCI